VTSNLPVTLAEAVDAATARLRSAGVESPRRDARLLICSVLGGGPELLLSHPERPLDHEEAQQCEAAVRRRERREPVSRILGRREFWSLEFLLGPETLDPRPDSETLVEAVLAWLQRAAASGAAQRDGYHDLRLLDLGCGSGCLLLALLSELPEAEGLGIDAAPGAVALSRRNARHLGLAQRAQFQEGSWHGGLPPAPNRPDTAGAWDIIVSNPPYIPSAEIAVLAPEVARHEPRLALDGGTDGLEAYRALIPAAAAVLHPRGLLALEVGAGQAEAVSALLRNTGFAALNTACDLSGTVRCVLATQARKSRGSALDSR